ncbi:MAG: hypothetical protein ACFFCS_12600 [Candidatus Hodarchaeota archaeon]
MKLSSKGGRIASRPSKLTEELPLIAQIPFEDLTSAPESVKITPISCKNCEGVLLDIKRVKDDEKLGLYFACAYCGTINKLGSLPDNYPSGKDIEYIIEEAGEKETEIASKKGITGDHITAIIDISGSMSGAKLAAVKHSLVQSIKDMRESSKGSSFLLITFESNVGIYLSPQEKAIYLEDTGGLLNSEDKIEEFIKKKIKDLNLGAIEKTANAWINQVQGLRSLDMTALGPALVSGVDIYLLRKLEGRILLLTDGLANIGLGRLEGGGGKESKKFYEKIAKVCLDNNIIVDVVGVGGGNELALDVLGQLSDKTGGEIFFVSADELESTFGELDSRHFIGKDVSMRVFTPKALEINEVSGISASTTKAKRFEEIKVGSVTRDREAFIQFDLKEEIKEEDVPVQVQVEFKDEKGNKKLRVFETRLKPEEEEEEYKKEYDARPLSVMKIQQAGNAYSKGDVAKAKAVLQQTKGWFEAQNLMAAAPEEACESIGYLDDELEQLDEFEEEKAGMAAKSYSAMKGQKRFRMSLEKKKEEMKKRGK